MTNPIDALNRARQAWENTQPQLVLDGWADALDDTDPSAHLRVGVIERETAQPPLDGTRSTNAAPNHTRTKALTACSHRVGPVPRLPLAAGSSVPHHNNEAGGSR